jgi:hypothetical protein
MFLRQHETLDDIRFLADAKEGLLTGISGIWQELYMKVCVCQTDTEPE